MSALTMDHWDNTIRKITVVPSYNQLQYLGFYSCQAYIFTSVLSLLIILGSPHPPRIPGLPDPQHNYYIKIDNVSYLLNYYIPITQNNI